ncbi:hypothetical protein [Vibrio parahaemolyticus]|uniref:hypothetical protein n=1 Tax=Vibrio parahaemolyticus TaxID=670 RepID=UPI002362275A|nr:hypothetical protein [Vibrio parahaemolyticus]HCG6791072.1 hypothetical protein [Vibrio parahaemolyticus]HCM1418214.1 hypothetical protein [Vibrio parahaemolyticus]
MNIKIKIFLSITLCSSFQLFAQNMNNSSVAMAYVCWHIANGEGYVQDSDLFAKMISMVRKLPDFKPESHYDYMGYAAQQVLNLDSSERKSMYNYGCEEPLQNIKRAESQGMLN